MHHRVFLPLHSIAVVMNSSAEPSQFPQNRGELYLQAMNLRSLKQFDEALGVLERLQLL